jgi:very-short-patch-repair endonuclease
VTVAQLEALGLGRSGVQRRAAAGRLHRVHRGVYAVGHRALSDEARWMAAVLACGPGAVLSHRSAAELWQLLKPIGGRVDVTVPSAAGRRKRGGLHIHRCPSLLRQSTTVRSGIPVTTTARTLADLKRTVPDWLYRRALRQAEYLGLDTGGEGDGTRSDLESAFLRLCRRHGLPEPERNVRVGPFTVDFLWRDEGLVVETDGYAAHRGRQAFLDDRARELELSARGLRLRRFSDEQIGSESAGVVAAVVRELRG